MPAIGRMPMMTAIHKSEPSPAHGHNANSWLAWEREKRKRSGGGATPEQIKEHIESISKKVGYTGPKRKIV